jgi:hypothetical protein
MANHSAECAHGGFVMRKRTGLTALPVICRLTAVAFALFAFAPAQAVPLTGTPVGNSFGWVPNSTNDLNYNKLVPGREGQNAPYVLFNSNAVGQVTLDFYNPSVALAFFEYRIDGVDTGATSHPIVIGDVIHPGVSVGAGLNSLAQVFVATQFVDIRLALGGERDWDFDWTRFEAQSSVPLPAALPLFATGLGGLGLLGWRRKRKRAARAAI